MPPTVLICIYYSLNCKASKYRHLRFIPSSKASHYKHLRFIPSSKASQYVTSLTGSEESPLQYVAIKESPVAYGRMVHVRMSDIPMK